MTEITWHDHAVTREQREVLLRQKGCLIWFTGLSGSGKSTIANVVDHKLYASDIKTYLLDGDNVRHGLSASPQILAAEHGEQYANRFGLAFVSEDRQENIRRIAAVGQLFVAAGLITLTAFVSPYRRDREAARALITAAGTPGDFIEVFVDTPLEVCELRDPKGLYKKARAGEIKNFTGIDDPYEAPANPELVLAGGSKTPDELANEVIQYLESKGKLS